MPEQEFPSSVETHYYTPESEMSNRMCQKKIKNSKTYLSVGKVITTVFWDWKRSIPIRDVILLHDNNRPQTATLSKDKLVKMHWETFEHAPYSSDLSSCNYCLFESLKEALGGGRFENDQAVENYVCNWLMQQIWKFF